MLMWISAEDHVSLSLYAPVSALLFSATFRRKVERLARDILADPVRVVQGEAGVVRGNI